jgi:hypothetical protein
MNEPNLKDVELVVLVVVDEAAPSLGNGHVHQMICLHIFTHLRRPHTSHIYRVKPRYIKNLLNLSCLIFKNKN